MNDHKGRFNFPRRTTTFAGSLPDELHIRILSLLDFREIVRCQAVCRYYRDLITGSVKLQYTIELAVANCVDGPASNPLSIRERLEALRRHQEIWANPDSEFEPVVDIDTSHYGGSHKWALYGGVVLTAYAEGYLYDDGLGRKFFNRIKVSYPAVNTSHWLILVCAYTDFVADPAQDLLILWDGSTDHDTPWTALSLHDGRTHPLSRCPLPLAARGLYTGVHLFGSWLAFSEVDRGFSIIDWRTGAVLLPRLTTPGNGCVLSESCFVVSGARRTMSMPCMVLFVLTPAEAGRGFKAIPVATYHLPGTRRVIFNSFPSSCCATGNMAPSAPFYTSSRMQLLVVHVGMHTTTTIIILADMFRTAAARWEPGDAHKTVSWSGWMPEATWCFPHDLFRPQRHDILSGYRVVLPTLILDFNPLSVARELCKRHSTRDSAQQQSASKISLSTENMVHGDYSVTIYTKRPYRETEMTTMMSRVARRYMADSNFIIFGQAEGTILRVMGAKCVL